MLRNTNLTIFGPLEQVLYANQARIGERSRRVGTHSRAMTLRVPHSTCQTFYGRRKSLFTSISTRRDDHMRVPTETSETTGRTRDVILKRRAFYANVTSGNSLMHTYVCVSCSMAICGTEF